VGARQPSFLGLLTLADLLEYPDEEWARQLELCQRLVAGEGSEIAAAFLGFYRKVCGLSVSALQELYTRTFDLNPVCTLEVGYHLFGENYKRGIFLARLRETESRYYLGQEQQLPDYLPVLLRLLVKLDDDELRRDLITECLIPAVDKMKEALSHGESPYADLIGIVGAELKLEVLELCFARS
jgi:nitrate reductase delta subunit